MYSKLFQLPREGVGTEMNPFFPKYVNGKGITAFSIKEHITDGYIVEVRADKEIDLTLIALEPDVIVINKKESQVF